MRTKEKIIAESATISEPTPLVTTVTVLELLQPGRLSDEEKELLRALQEDLKRGGKASLASAKALFTIDARRLYPGHSDSMYGYGQRWALSPAYTSRLIKGGAIYFQLEPLWQKETLPEPSSEWQLRPLACLGGDVERLLAWKKAVNRLRARTHRQ